MTGPRQIYVHVGERLTQAFLTGDFDLFCRCVHLPLKLSIRDGKAQVIGTTKELRDLVGRYRSLAQIHRVSDLYRELVSVEETAPGEITAIVRISVLSGGNLVTEPFTVTHTLQEFPAGWRIVQINGTLGETNWNRPASPPPSE